MSIISIENLTFSYEGSYDNVFENVSLSIDTDWRLGLIGRNGRGKTTFLSLLMGKFEYRGKIETNVLFDYFPFNVKDKNKNALDIVEEISPNYEYWKLCRELNLLDLGVEILERPFKTLSGGEQTKFMLAVLFSKDNNFLLIDEPTNNLDTHGREKIGKYLKSKRGFILVSHDRYFLDCCIDHVLSINRVDIDIQQGNFSSWWRNKENTDNFELAKNEKLKKDIKKLERSAKQKADWSEKVEKTKHGTRNSGLRPDRGFIGHKAAKMMKRSKDIENRRNKAIDSKSKLLKNIEVNDSLKIGPLIYRKDRLIQISNLLIFYGENQICEGINLVINKGDIISIKGRNGCGKSSLLRIILGENIKYSGDIDIPTDLKISYVAQSTAYLKGSLSDIATNSNIDESLFKTILRKLDFTRAQFEKNVEDFSEGQKKKVLIARSLCEKAHLYVWDEPLNFVDILSRIQIENLILEYKPTMIFVEHDEIFSNKISNKYYLINAC